MDDISGTDAAKLFDGPSEMHARCQALNWAQTNFGPVYSWPPGLKVLTQTVLASTFPSIILWGPELIQIYNDGYQKLIADQYPDGLGQSAWHYWSGLPALDQSVYQRVHAGESFFINHAKYDVAGLGKLANACFHVSYSPARTESGEIMGILITLFEITTQAVEQKPSHQQQQFLLLLSDALRPLADPQAIQYEAICVLGKFLGANRTGYAETQQNKQLVAVTKNYTHQLAGIEGVYSYKDYGQDLLQRMMEGKTVVRHDIVNDPGLTSDEKQAHAVLQLGATLNVPLVKDGELVAILFVHFAQAHHFSAQEVALAEETAERTWAALERARLEADLRMSEQQLSAIFNQAMSGLARGNRKGILDFVNQRYCQMLGYDDAAEILGKKMQDFTHPDDRSLNLELFSELVHTGKPFSIEKRYIRKDGTVIWVHNSVSALQDDDGSINQLLAVCTDITDRKQAETALLASEQKYRQLSVQLEERVLQRTKQLELLVSSLERSNDNLQQFAYIASHDLQEPLRKIQQFGDRLKEVYNKPENNGLMYLERMLSSAQRMSALIHDLLGFSQISTKTGHTQLIQLDALILDVLGNLEFTILEQNAQINLGALPTIKGNASQLGQLFQNLLSNALKFHRPGTTPEVKINAERVTSNDLPAGVIPGIQTASYHKIEITDNGIGFDEQYLDRIFKMFQRLHSKSQFEGTGIGLAICERVVVNHGGAIIAHSQPGHGSTFIIFLPVTDYQ